LLGVVGRHAPVDTQIFAVNALEQLIRGLAVVTCVGLYIWSRQRVLPWAYGFLAVAALLLYPFYIIFEQGMETTLAVLLLLCVIYAFVSERLVLLGLTLALLFLTRLDSAVFIAGPLLLWTVAKHPRDGGAWAGAAIFATTFCIYVAINLATTGHPVPISGVLKSSFPALRWQGAFFGEPITIARMFGWRSLLYGINMVSCTALLVVGATCLLIAWRRAPDIRNKLLMLGVVAALLVINLLAFQKWDKSIDPRYLAMPMTIAIFFVAASFRLLVERVEEWLAPAGVRERFPRASMSRAQIGRRILNSLPLAVICVALVWEARVQWARLDSYAGRRDDLVRQIYMEVDKVLPKDAVVAGTDVGAMAFWTQRRVINLDGVINNFAYQDYLRDGRLREYLREQGVTHIATGLWDREQSYTGRPIERMYREVLDPPAVHSANYKEHEFYVYSYLYNVESDRIALKPGDEVYRRFLGKDGVADAAYVVYRLQQ